MFRIKLLFLCLTAVLVSCGSVFGPAHKSSSNTELIVHYNGVEVHRRGSKYLTKQELTDLSDSKKDFIVIFTAKWCSACVFTDKVIKQSKLKKKIYYLNLDEDWVKHLAALLEIRGVPFLMHIDKRGITVAKKLGPMSIIDYLIPRFR